MDGRQPPQIAGYREEADEGAQQAHVQLPQQGGLHRGQRPQHQDRQQTVGQNAEHRQQAQQEQHAVQGQLPGLPQGLRVHRGDLEIPGQDRQGRRGQAGQTDPRQGQHHREKVPGGEPIGSVKIEVLGIAHRRGHAAQVCGNGLQYQQRHRRGPAVQLVQKQQCKWGKGDEGNVIGHGHGAEKGQQHQDHRQGPGPGPPGQQTAGQPLERPAGLEARHHRHQAQQQAQHPQIDVVQIGGVRRHQDHGGQCAERRHGQHRLPLEKRQQSHFRPSKG